MIETIAVGIAIAAVGIAVVSVLVLLNGTPGRNATARENSFAGPGDAAVTPWIDTVDVDSHCDSGSSSDAGCGDGGGDGGD
jgi:hypothetical protein